VKAYRVMSSTNESSATHRLIRNLLGAKKAHGNNNLQGDVMYTVEGLTEANEVLIRISSDELEVAISMVNDSVKDHYGSTIKCTKYKEGGGTLTCSMKRVDSLDQMIDYARHNLSGYTYDWLYHSHY
jgi:hypothetical protein